MEIASKENLEWAEAIATEIWLHLATQCIREGASTFTLTGIKNTSQFMIHHENILRLALEILLKAEKIHLPPEARGRILTYTVDRVLAEAFVPPDEDEGANGGDEDDDEKEEDDEEEEGGQEDQARGDRDVADKSKRKKRRLAKNPEPHPAKLLKPPPAEPEVVFVPVYHPPPPNKTLACPVSDACLSALQTVLSLQEGGMAKKSVVLEQLCDGGGSESRADVEAALFYLQEDNKIMLDDDDIYLL